MNINLTLIAQLISFAFFVWFTKKYVWPHIMTALDERKQKIADGLAAAERGVKEQALAEERATERLKEAHAEGPSKGVTVNLDAMLPQYYAHRGWDEEASNRQWSQNDLDTVQQLVPGTGLP